MRIHEPIFPENQALYIIWAEDGFIGRRSVAAGCLTAMLAAWQAIQGEFPNEELTMQNGSRVMHRRSKLRH